MLRLSCRWASTVEWVVVLVNSGHVVNLCSTFVGSLTHGWESSPSRRPKLIVTSMVITIGIRSLGFVITEKNADFFTETCGTVACSCIIFRAEKGSKCAENMCHKHSGLPHVTILLVLIDYTWLVEESQSATKNNGRVFPCFFSKIVRRSCLFCFCFS